MVHKTITDIAMLATLCAKETTLPALSGHIEGAVRDFGFRWFVLSEMIDLQRDDRQGVIIQDYPSSWLDELIERRLFTESPILTAAARSFGGICWSKIYERFPATDRQREITLRARDHGLKSGFTISMPVPGTSNVAFTVARSKSVDVSEYEKIAIRAIATIALENSGRILSPDSPAKAITLSARQRKCTILVAQGKTDWEIGKILGISRDTVHEYVEAARKKYDVRTRTQLVLAAFRNGELSELDDR